MTTFEKNWKYQQKAGIISETKPLTETEILSSLKRLWRLAQGKKQEKEEYYQNHRKSLGEEQELRR